MTAFAALVRKDLKLFFGDRRAVVVSLLVPIVLASFFGYLFGGKGGNAETSKVKVLVIDQDGSNVSRELSTEFASEKNLDVKPSDLDSARAAVRKGSVSAAVVIPKGFGHDAGRALFAGGAKPELSVLYDPSHRMELEMVKGLLAGSVMKAVSKEVFGGSTGREMINESLARMDENTQLQPADRKALRDLLNGVNQWNEQREKDIASGQQSPAGGLTMPYSTRDEAVTSGDNVAYNGYAHSFGGMAIQFILFMGLDAGIALLTLRQTGLWQRLRAAPLSRVSLLGSRAVSAALVAGFILAVLFSFAHVAFGVRILGSMIGFVGICAAFSLMTASFGLMIAALGNTPEATRGYSIMATLFMVMLGGAWVPTFVFPAWLQKFSLIVPTRWAMDGLDGMTWRGLGLDAALPGVGVLLLFAGVFGAVALLRFRWRADG